MFRPHALFLSFGILVVLSRDVLGAEVTWNSPLSGDVYMTGETVMGAWQTDDHIHSPSFRLCHDYSDESSSSTSCGATVWPNIEKNGSISYTTLAVPNMTLAGSYRLVMKDDEGELYKSPLFSLSPNNSSTATELSLPASTARSFPYTNSLTSTEHSQTTTATIVSVTSQPQFSNKAPVAAIAIPLSLCGALAITAILCLLRRKQNTDVAPATEKIYQPRVPPQPIQVHLPMCQNYSNLPALPAVKQECNAAYALPVSSSFHAPAPVHDTVVRTPLATYTPKENLPRSGDDYRLHQLEMQRNKERELEREWKRSRRREYVSLTLPSRFEYDDHTYYSNELREDEELDKWVLDREKSIIRRRHELDTARKKQADFRRYIREREHQIDLEHWERRERERYQQYKRGFDRWPSYHSKHSEYSQFQSRSTSPTRVASRTPSFTNWGRDSVTADILDGYTIPPPPPRSQSVSLARPRSRSRARPLLSHTDDLLSEAPARDIYAAVERAIGTHTPRPQESRYERQ